MVLFPITSTLEWTDQRLMALPDDGHKYERVNEGILMSPAGFEHGGIAIRLSSMLWSHVAAHRLGMILDSSTGFRLSNGNVRSPDISFVAAARLRGMKRPPRGFFEGAPDLAVEILSPGNTVDEIHERLVDLFTNGTRLVWVVNPIERNATIYRAPEPIALVRIGECLEGEELLPAFSYPLADLFAEWEF